MTAGQDRPWPPESMGMARLTTMAFHGENMVPPAIELLKRAEADAGDSAALLDLSTIHFLLGHEEAGLAYQDEALVNWDPIDKTVLADEQVSQFSK